MNPTNDPSRRSSNDNPFRSTHPDMRNDAPGRIPESLIDAAIDGELNEDMQREIAHALRYDPMRKQELIDTADAINALQMPISVPDFAEQILARADRQRRFIPASWRKKVRAGRLGIAAALLLTLMCVSLVQRNYPRWTTIAAHPTPVRNIESAIEQGTNQIASSITSECQTIQSSIAPMASLLQAPGKNNQRFDVSLASDDRTPSASHARFPSVRYDLASVSAPYAMRTRLVTVYVDNRALVLMMPDDAPGAEFANSSSLLTSSGVHRWSFGTSLADRGYPHSTAPSSLTKSVELEVQSLP